MSQSEELPPKSDWVQVTGWGLVSIDQGKQT